MKFDVRTRLFVVLAALFLTCLLVADLIGGKLYAFRISGHEFVLSMGMLPFPIVFLLTDIINEFYGKRAARFVTLVGFVMALITIAIIVIAGSIPWAAFTADPTWTGFDSPSWTRIFANSTWMLFASVITYITSQMLDILVFHGIKRATHNRYLWLRATGSTVVSQAIDTLVITFLAFKGKLPLATLLGMCLTSYTIKLVVAVSLTPLIYAGHAFVERVLGLHPVVLGPDGQPAEQPVPERPLV
jgi:queuosine precursor transporter